MGIAILTFIAMFLIVVASGLFIASRSGAVARLSAAIEPAAEHDGLLARISPDRARESLQAIIEPFDRILPKTASEVSVVQTRLIRAGYRQHVHLRMFYGSKVVIPVLLAVVVWSTNATQVFSPFIGYTMALGLGYLLPDFWLGNRIKKRQAAIKLGIPDFLDLLVVCVEAGLSIDQAIARTTRELSLSQPEICDEMSLLLLEQRAGNPRADAWRRLAERVDIEVIRTLVSSLIQADQFGTSISKTLRVYSDGLRIKRRQEIEERAARTTVKLVFPLVFFIFPSIFIVALGPSLLVMADAVNKYFK